MRFTCAISAIVFAGVVSSGSSFAQQPDLGTDAQREAGKQVYDEKCAQCHGYEGDGNGVAKYFFDPTPRDFTDGLFKIRTTQSGELPTDEDLKKIIREGMPYTGMPAWTGLSGEKLTNVVYYIKTFYDLFADPDFVAAPIEIPKAPGFSEESAQKGKVLYEENKCADCHGALGRGYGKSALTLQNEWHERIWPADLTKRWTFRGGSKREDIYRTFTTGLNGTPMPSYADLIDEEGRWNLVDYVYSFSRDEPDYATVVRAAAVEGEIDIDAGADLFTDAKPALFPVIGQIVEPGRNFYPGTNAVEVRAVYSATEVAFLLTWNDMTAGTSGTNGPLMSVPGFDPGGGSEETDVVYSDAVAIQTSTRPLGGSASPYFLFGDRKRPVDLWYVDLSKSEGEILVAKGSQAIEGTGEMVPVRATHADGQWNVICKRNRHPEKGYSFDEGVFAPIAFSIWDGFRNERGSSRGVTAWYYLYLEPMVTESPVVPVAGYGLLTLLLEVGLILVVRKKSGPR